MIRTIIKIIDVKNTMKDVINKIKVSNINAQNKLYLLSLAYQLNNDYDDELELLRNSSFDNDYLKERLHWHNLPNQEKFEKRPPLYTERTPDFDPSILNQLCFVSGCDTNYYEMLVECIESIKNTVVYRDVPFFVLDCGLTESQKSFLATVVTKIIDPGWDIKIGRMSKSCYKAMTSRPFLPKHFPGFRYYFWMDADSWVQDEKSLDRYVNLCLKQGIGICQNTDPTYFLDGISQCKLEPIIAPDLFTPDLWENAYSFCVGHFCIDAESDIFTRWQNIFTNNIQARGFNFFSEQTSINIAAPDLEVLQKHDNFSVCSRCALLHTNNEHLMYEDVTNKLIGIVHLISNAKKRGFSEFLPKRDTPLTTEREIRLYRHYLNRLNAYKGYKNIHLPDLVRACTRFRTYPWQNKPQLREIFNRKLDEFLLEI